MRLDLYERLRRALEEDRPVAVATVVDGPDSGRQLLVEAGGEILGDLGTPELNRRAAERAADALSSLEPQRLILETPEGAIDLFVEVHPPPPRLIVVGAVHLAIHLVAFAKALGFRTAVVDPRSAFATADRFPHADQLILRWPDEALADLRLDEATYLAVLSHDPKLDLAALRVALRQPVRYIGALGSRRTHAKRIAALRNDGFGDQELGRIHSPIGLALGGRRAEEIALAVIAEIVAVSHGRKLVPATPPSADPATVG